MCVSHHKKTPFKGRTITVRTLLIDKKERTEWNWKQEYTQESCLEITDRPHITIDGAFFFFCFTVFFEKIDCIGFTQISLTCIFFPTWTVLRTGFHLLLLWNTYSCVYTSSWCLINCAIKRKTKHVNARNFSLLIAKFIEGWVI